MSDEEQDLDFETGDAGKALVIPMSVSAGG